MDRLAAMRSEREACLRFCRQLSPEQWQAPSAAEGWRIQDVVAHMGGIAHEFFTPYMAKVIRARSIERYNDQTVERRALSWTATSRVFWHGVVAISQTDSISSGLTSPCAEVSASPSRRPSIEFARSSVSASTIISSSSTPRV